jgi:ElaB/YqjD/DUF883 family membrane-anchored ribosome-binding protein
MDMTKGRLEMKSVKSFTKLANKVEELLGELEDSYNPEVQELRGRVEDTLSVAKRAIGQEGKKASARIAQYAGSVNEYINDYPRLAFLTGALIFGTIGYLAGTAAREREQ